MASQWDNVNGDLAASLRGLMSEAGGRISIVSGYRSPERQQQLWAQALRKYGSAEAARKWVAPPGASNHNKGAAFDLGGDLQLAHMLAPKYGLSFPMGHEPWHIEMAGQRNSSHPAAYTTPPEDDSPAGSGDPTDQVFATLSNLLNSPADTSAVGEAAVDTSTPAPSDDLGSDLSGATAVPGPGGTVGGGGEDVDRFMAAISGQESGGNYNATNASSGASGKFQIMPANWSSWAQEAGLGANAPRTPENQDKVARSKMQQYYNQFGNWRSVAEAWYGGPGAVGYSAATKQRKQGQYPSISDYANQVMSRMGG